MTTSLVFSMRDDQWAELARRLPTRFTLSNEISPVELGGDVFRDVTTNLDAYVLRCIGTMNELQDHQASGGAIFLEYPDGGIREVRIDPGQDGLTLPRRNRAPEALTPPRRSKARHWRI